MTGWFLHSYRNFRRYLFLVDAEATEQSGRVNFIADFTERQGTREPRQER